MKDFITILEDSNPLNNWRIIAHKDNTIWLEESISPNEKKFRLVKSLDENYDTSILYEVDLISKKKKEIKLHSCPYLINDLIPTGNYLYASIIIDANNDGRITKDDQDQGQILMQFNRNSEEIKILHTFKKDDGYQSVNIKQALEDLAILLHVSVIDGDDIVERYDLFRFDNNLMENIYIDNEDMIDCQVFLTKLGEEPVVILDLHVTPSDKRISGGLSDKILVLK